MKYKPSVNTWYVLPPFQKLFKFYSLEFLLPNHITMNRYSLLFLLVLSAHCSNGQSSGFSTQSLSLVLGDILNMNFLTNDAVQDRGTDMVFKSPRDYYQGIESEQQTVRISSNRNIAISVRAIDFQNASNPEIRIPSFIYLKVPRINVEGNSSAYSQQSQYQPLEKKDLLLPRETEKGGDQTFKFQYKAKPGGLVEPGIYFLNVVFTATRF
jgi:hypothetical protein